MKKKGILFLIPIIMLLLLSGVLVVFLVQKNNEQVSSGQEETENTGVRTFADWSDEEVFQTVPAMIVEGGRIHEAVDYGDENYVINVKQSKLDDYKAYLTLLEENGYEKYVDNGENGLVGAVYTSIYKKDDVVLTLTHMVNINTTYISARFNLPLSEHLFYNEKYVEGNVEGAKTKLHMLELYDYGNSFIFELKNGHFIVMDGGMTDDAKYLLDYLENLTPGDEKPVIDAWILSHAHGDHVGALGAISKDTKDAARIYVDGIYFNQPSDAVCGAYDPTARAQIQNIKVAPLALKTSDGESPKIYRTQTGQRYYFNDFTMDIVLAQDQMLKEYYSGDLNDSSTWLMFTIDGQKSLFGGDGEVGNMKNVMRTYGQDYMNFDIFQALHHNGNTRDDFTDYCTTKVVLAAHWEFRETAANNHLAEVVEEVIDWGDGTKILTLPYKVGTVEDLPNLEWIYHPKRMETGEK